MLSLNKYMPHFLFKAKKPSGEVYQSEKHVSDRYELYRLIRDRGDDLVSLQEAKFGTRLHIDLFSGASLFSGGIKLSEKINFARNLGSMLEAGLMLSRALSVMERQTSNKTLKTVLTDLIAEIGRGTALAESMSKHPKAFSPLFISMVHAGEQSGTLSESLKIVAIQLENSYILERRVKGALIYPAIVVGIMILIAVIMMIFVVPTLMKTFAELHVTLPLTTQIVLGISNLIRDQGLYVLAGILIFAGAIYTWSKNIMGKKVLHAVVLRIPLIGPLVHEINAARTARTLSSLLNSGVEVVESVKITSEVVQNFYFRKVLEKAGDAISKGELMSKVFKDNEKLYPIFMSEMMSVGEETGKISEMLMGVARYYEDDIEHRTKDLSTILEPLIMVVIAAGVGFFAIAMISPMYSLVNAI